MGDTDKDKLIYLVNRARGEAIRMLYTVAGVDFDDVRVDKPTWTSDYKADAPLGQCPVLHTSDGVICLSNTIARHVAKKFNLMGEGLWEETLHDMVTEAAMSCVNTFVESSIHRFTSLKTEPVPENSAELVQKATDCWIPTLKFIQSIAEKRGKKYIVGDELGLAELWLFAAVEFCNTGLPGLMELSPWLVTFVERAQEDPKLKKHLEERPHALV